MRILSLEEYIDEVGQFGWFQARTQFLFALFMFPLSTQIFISYFVVHDPPWRCVANSTKCRYNDTITPQDHVRFKHKCNVPRSEWEFTTPKRYSLVTEFELVCDKEKYAIASVSMLFIGWSIGGTGIAYASDRIGRKLTIFMCTTVILIVVIVSVVVSNVIGYIVSRFIIGMFLGGGPVTIFVLAAEIVGSKYRAFSCAVIWIYYAFALAGLALVAYFARAWRLIELIISVPFLLLVLSWRYFPESIRWMSISGKHKEAEALLASIASVNKRTVPNAILATPPTIEGGCSILRIFYPCEVFLETFVQMTIWFCAGLTYYAISLASQDMTGNFYSDFVFISLAEIPASIALIYLCNKIGRKKTVISHLYLSVVACVAVAYIPLEQNNNVVERLCRFTAGIIGKYAVSVYFNSVYVWSAELIPTVVRTQGVGLLVVVSRIGGALSPIVTTTLKTIRADIPFMLLAICNLITGTMTFTLRETKGSVIFDTIEEKLSYMGVKQEEKSENTSLRD